MISLSDYKKQNCKCYFIKFDVKKTRAFDIDLLGVAISLLPYMYPLSYIDQVSN